MLCCVYELRKVLAQVEQSKSFGNMQHTKSDLLFTVDTHTHTYTARVDTYTEWIPTQGNIGMENVCVCE